MSPNANWLKLPQVTFRAPPASAPAPREYHVRAPRELHDYVARDREPDCQGDEPHGEGLAERERPFEQRAQPGAEVRPVESRRMTEGRAVARHEKSADPVRDQVDRADGERIGVERDGHCDGQID